MAELFGNREHTITYHLKVVYGSEELVEMATTRKIRVVRNKGNREVARDLDFYTLYAIISVGYRVNSRRATQFRIWATKVLQENIVNGFVMNDVRL
jgi:hypothetical protein